VALPWWSSIRGRAPGRVGAAVLEPVGAAAEVSGELADSAHGRPLGATFDAAAVAVADPGAARLPLRKARRLPSVKRSRKVHQFAQSKSAPPGLR
jgi:hypothetical protein